MSSISAEELGALVVVEVAERVDGLVGLHRRQEPSGPGRGHLPQGGDGILVVELLEHVGRLVGVQRVEELLALRAAELLEEVGDLGRSQAVQLVVGLGQADAVARARRRAG